MKKPEYVLAFILRLVVVQDLAPATGHMSRLGHIPVVRCSWEQFHSQFAAFESKSQAAYSCRSIPRAFFHLHPPGRCLDRSHHRVPSQLFIVCNVPFCFRRDVGMGNRVRIPCPEGLVRCQTGRSPWPAVSYAGAVATRDPHRHPLEGNRMVHRWIKGPAPGMAGVLQPRVAPALATRVSPTPA